MTSRARPSRQADNLPGEITSFVGRRRETAQAVRLLRTARLLTLTGVAGVGKTRLALRVAAQVREAFPHGVWLVELATLTDENLLPQTLADVLRIRDQLHAPSVGMLAHHLADKQLLLVLDNCEHLVEASAVLVNELLAAAPRLRVLATSRQALGAAGEQLLEVPPLPVPDPDRLTTTRTAARHDAVRLFAERAAAARPRFALTAGNSATIARICRRLDGIPLAIELVALRVRAMPVTDILTGLDDYLEFPATGNQHGLPHLQPLRAAIDWSFALCSRPERQLWARASVFAGGFDLDAAEAVCSDQDIAQEDVLDLVTALVDKSVLVRAHDDHGTLARYRMLAVIRHYGREQLGSSHLTAVRVRHRDHYRRLATRSEQEWLGPNELTWFVRLRHEHANLRAALEFCTTHPDQERTGLEITAALWHYWIRSCTHTEGRYWLDRALRLDPEPSTHRAKALGVNGWLALMQADITTAQSLLEQSRELAHQVGDELALARATLGFGVAAFNQNDHQNAIPLLQEAQNRHEALGDPTGVWLALLYLAAATAVLGDTDRAIAFSEECLALCDTRSAYPSRIYALSGLGLGRWLAGDRQEAHKLIREGLPAARRLDDRWILAHYLEILAWITGADGYGERAARLLGAADTVWRSTGMPPSGPRYLASSHDHCEHATRHALGDEQFTASFRHGARLTLDQAIDYALEPAGHHRETDQ